MCSHCTCAPPRTLSIRRMGQTLRVALTLADLAGRTSPALISQHGAEVFPGSAGGGAIPIPFASGGLSLAIRRASQSGMGRRW